MQQRELTLGLLIELEKLLGTQRMEALLRGDDVTATFEEKRALLGLIMNPEVDAGRHMTDTDFDAMTAADVSRELSFFMVRLAASTSAGAQKVLHGLLTALASPQGIQHLETLTATSYPMDALLNSWFTVLLEGLKKIAASAG